MPKPEEDKYFNFVALFYLNALGMNMMLTSLCLMEVWINWNVNGDKIVGDIVILCNNLKCNLAQYDNFL